MSNINLNNLEDRKADLRTLGATEESVNKMEENMKKGLPYFTIRQTKPTANGHVDISFPFKRSEKSDNYFMSKFTVEYHKIKPLEEGQSYFIITPRGDGKNDVKKLSHPVDAIEQFKKREGTAELAVGKDVAHKTTLASMEKGAANFIAREFRSAFFGQPVDQTFFTENGKGFTVPQAANLIQGRAVHRDDLVDARGNIFKAWLSLDMDSGKSGLNFKLTTRRDPEYGFDLTKVLSDYNIKGIDKTEYRDELEAALKNGDRVSVVARSDGKNEETSIETAVRFHKINFFKPDGSTDKRERFLTNAAQETLMEKNKEKELAQGHEMTR